MTQQPNPCTTSTPCLLWVDSVGGYLACSRADLMIGRAVPQAQVDIPIVADIRRRHARLRRIDSTYLLEPLGEVSVDGVAISEPTLLKPGQVVQLGSAVRLRFTKPHPVSNTAVIEILSRHYTQPRCDRVLLVAESIILGPETTSHVVCPLAEGNVILFRQGDQQWRCRSAGDIEVGSQIFSRESAVPVNQQVGTASITFTMEPMNA